MDRDSMDICRRLNGATAVITLALQVCTAAVGAVRMCAETVHTHGGVQAPECPMHHRQPAAPVSDPDHQHHADAADHAGSGSSSRVGCRCPSETKVLPIGDIGMVSDRFFVRVPTPLLSAVAPVARTTFDLQTPPLSPPPRTTLS